MAAFELDKFLPYRLAVLSSRVSRDFAERYRSRFGLSVAEWRVMAHLAHSDRVSVRDIHLRADLEKSKASRAAARLEAAGLVTKEADPDDRRLIALSLTEKGRSMMAELIPMADRYEAELNARMTDEERLVLARVIDRLLAAD